MRRPRLTYANVVATLALIFAMTGTGLAASHYVITSINQIKPSVRNALHTQVGRVGEARGPRVEAREYTDAESTASCPSGTDVISGGWGEVSSGPEAITLNAPANPHSWTVRISNPTNTRPAYVEAFAICAPAGRAIAASHEGGRR